MPEQNPVSHDAEQPSSAVVLRRMLSGAVIMQLIYVAAKLGIADLLHDGPKNSHELATATQTHPRALYRVLRTLASVGIFSEQGEGNFTLTPLAELLRTAVPNSQRSLAIMYGEGAWWDALGNLLYSVQTGNTAFDHVHHLGIFEYLSQHPDAAKIFNEAMMNSTARDCSAVLAAYDFSGVVTVIDIGGGHGLLMAALLQAYPQMRGILFDRAAVLAGASSILQREGVADNCACVAGDFFEAVPDGGDVYILRNILHDWDDAHALPILKNCRSAMREHARLLLLEEVILPGNTPTGKLGDIIMMVLPGGLERTAAEYTTLLRAAGFHLTRIIPTQSQQSIIEAIPV